MSITVWRFIVFGILGVFGEVVFTSIQGAIRERSFRLQGFSFLWMIPIYGLLAVLFLPIADAIARWPWPLRGIVYMLGIYLVEYLTGTLLTRIVGRHIWEYKDRFNLHGQITLKHAPIWFAVGLLVERYYPQVERIARFLASIS